MHFMNIYDPDNLEKIWLKIDGTNYATYYWLKLHTFEPTGITTYLAADLRELAGLLQLG